MKCEQFLMGKMSWIFKFNLIFFCTKMEKKFQFFGIVHANIIIFIFWCSSTIRHWLSIKIDSEIFALHSKNLHINVMQNIFLILVNLTTLKFTGYSSGEVFKYNMQSGQPRGRWGDATGAHKGPVRGVETDSLNSRLVTAGEDKRLKIWGFKESE